MPSGPRWESIDKIKLIYRTYFNKNEWGVNRMVNLKIVCEQRDCGADKLTVNKGKGEIVVRGKETAKLISVSE